MALTWAPMVLDRTLPPVRFLTEDAERACDVLAFDGGPLRITIDKKFTTQSGSDLRSYDRDSIRHLKIARLSSPVMDITFNPTSTAISAEAGAGASEIALRVGGHLAHLVEGRTRKVISDRFTVMTFTALICFWSLCSLIFSLALVMAFMWKSLTPSADSLYTFAGIFAAFAFLLVGSHHLSRREPPSPIAVRPARTGLRHWVKEWSVELGMLLAALGVVAGVLG